MDLLDRRVNGKHDVQATYISVAHTVIVLQGLL